MEPKNLILVAIGILVLALVAVSAYSYFADNATADVAKNDTGNSTKPVINIDKAKNNSIVGDNSKRTNTTNNTNNTTYKVYNPQSDSYVPVIGEKFDNEVNRWYTYDSEGVRYYNTRIN